MFLRIKNKSSPRSKSAAPPPYRPPWAKGQVTKASDWLAANRAILPEFLPTRLTEYNGVVVRVDDDDAPDLMEALEDAGFEYSE
jgi:hypothetical protein